MLKRGGKEGNRIARRQERKALQKLKEQRAKELIVEINSEKKNRKEIR